MKRDLLSKQPSFPIGALVRLATCPHGAPGIVVGQRRSMIHVRWSDLDYTSHHRADRLVAADINQKTMEEKCDTPEI